LSAFVGSRHTAEDDDAAADMEAIAGVWSEREEGGYKREDAVVMNGKESVSERESPNKVF